MKRMIAALALLALSVIAGGNADAQSFTVKTLLNSSQTRPDQNTPWYLFGPPALDQYQVIFMTKNAQVFATLDGIWDYDLTKSAPRKLAGLSTPVPGGTGDFSGFGLFYASDNPLPTASGGWAVFYGTDANGVHGLYAVRESTGQIYKIVTTATIAPDGSAFSYFCCGRTNGKTVTFYGQTASRSGIFQATANGKNLATVIDDTTNLDARGYGGGKNYYGGYHSPVIGASGIAFYATGVGDPSQYPNEIFQTNGAGGFVGVVDNLTPLKGDPKGLGHTQITGYSAAIDRTGYAFAAFDGSYAGIFTAGASIDAAAPDIVSTLTTVPGGGDKFSSFGGFAYDHSGVAFVGADSSFGQSVYFRTAGKGIVQIASGKSFYYPNLGDLSVSKGSVAFSDGSIFSNALYIATQK
jgi:hypothetical protein